MKKILSAVLLSASIFLTAQEKVVVEYKYRNTFDTSNVTDAHTLSLYKNSNDKIFYYTLAIDNDEAVFEDIPRVDNEQELEKPVISGPLGKTYLNLSTREKSYEVDYLGKYIIKDTIEAVEWKITRERDTYLGYEIRKATFKNDNVEYETWFAPALPLKFGPFHYNGLPGLIMKFTQYFNYNKGRHRREIVATKITVDPKLKITKPTKGKIVTQKEFNVIVDAYKKKYEEVENNKVETKID